MKKSMLSSVITWIVAAAIIFTMMPSAIVFAEEPGSIIFDEDCSSLKDLTTKGWTVNDPKSLIYITDTTNSTGNPDGVITQTVPEGQILFYADEAAPKDQNGVSALKLIDKQNLLKDRLTDEGKWYIEFKAKFDSLMKLSGAYVGDSGFSVFIDTGAKIYRITFSPDNKIILRNGAYGKYVEKKVDLHIGDGSFHNWAISHQGNGVICIVCDGEQVAFFTGIDVPSKIGESSWGDYGIQFINASLYGSTTSPGANKIYFDSMKFVINETAAGAVGDNSLVLYDDCSSLKDAGWAVTDPKAGVFINDSVNSVNNPNNIEMPQITEGQYMLYGDGTAESGSYSKMEKSVSIGQGAWELQFDAKFKDLITPAANNIYRGVSFEIFAKGLEYKITFNDQNKILAMTNPSSGSYIEKQVTMPVDDLFHKWAISYNGINKVYVKLDDVIVATFEGIAVGAANIADKVVIINASLNWSKGTNEVYIDNIKMVRTEAPVEDPNLLLNDDCTNLVEANWSVGAPTVGAYITDGTRSNGTIEGIKTVEPGKYLVYGDNTAKSYVTMAKNLNIGQGPWVIEFDARIVDLVTPSTAYGYRGFIFDIYAGGKEYKILFSGGNKIYAMTDKSGGAAQKFEVNMPDSSTYHKWGIAFDGSEKVIISLDGDKIGVFNNIGLTTTMADRITILNVPLSWQSGKTEVYLDNIKMLKNTVPDWAKFDPKINGCTVLPASDSTQLNLVVSTFDVNPEWFNDANVTVQAAVYKDGQILDSGYTMLDKKLVPLALNPQGNTGRMEIVMRLMNGTKKIDELQRNVEVHASVVFPEPSQTVRAEAGKTFIFDRMNELTDVKGRDPISSGWRKSQYSYEGTEDIYSVVESVYDSQPLTVPVKAEGWFGVYVGYISGTEEFKISDSYTEKTVVIEKKENQSTGTAAQQYGSKLVCESFAFAADFKGNGLKISQSNNRKARIAYIKLKSLSPEEIALYTKTNEGSDGKRVVYNNDGYSDFYMGYYSDTNRLKESAVNRYAGQDVSQLDWCLGTTLMLNYYSEYVGLPYQDLTPEQEENLMRDGDKKARDLILGFINAGINPGEVIAQRADELEINTNISLRMSAFYDMSSYPWLNGSIYKNFVNDTTDLRYVNKDGTKQNRLSYAYPQFREYIKNILKEAALFKGVDGVNLDFCRYPYVIGYEPVLTDAYKAKYGIDPKSETTAEGIHRWEQYKADVMTEFMRELRRELAGKSISVRIPYKDYFQYGFDLQKWISEGLIDVLIPSCISYEEFYDITPFANMVKGSQVKLYGGINADLAGHDLTKQEEDLIKRGVPVKRDNKYLNTQQYRLRARDLYNAGCEKIYIFNNWKGSESLGLLGDRVELEKWYGLAYPAEWVENPVTVTAPVSEYLSSIKVGNETISNFIYDKADYVAVLSGGTAAVPEVSAGAVDPKAKIEIVNAATLNDITTIKVTSSDGSRMMVYRVAFKVDGIPPVTNLMADAAMKNGWYSSDITVTLNSTDDEAGVDRTEYRISENDGWKVYSNPFVVNREGVHNIQFYSTDTAGNVEGIKQQTVQIDKTSPEFSAAVNGSDIKDVNSFDDYMPLTFKVWDNLSGVVSAKVIIDGTEYIIDPGAQQGVDLDLTGRTGSRTAAVIIEDAAGNRTEKNLTFTVTTSIDSVDILLDRYIESGDLKAPLAVQLTNSLKQARHQLEKGRSDQCVKHLYDFLKHLDNKALKGNVSEKAEEVLRADVNALILSF